MVVLSERYLVYTDALVPFNALKLGIILCYARQMAGMDDIRRDL